MTEEQDNTNQVRCFFFNDNILPWMNQKGINYPRPEKILHDFNQSVRSINKQINCKTKLVNTSKNL